MTPTGLDLTRPWPDLTRPDPTPTRPNLIPTRPDLTPIQFDLTLTDINFNSTLILDFLPKWSSELTSPQNRRACWRILGVDDELVTGDSTKVWRAWRAMWLTGSLEAGTSENLWEFILFRFIISFLFHIRSPYSTTRLCGSVEMFNLVYIWSHVLTNTFLCHVVTYELSFLITVIYSSSRPPQHTYFSWLNSASQPMCMWIFQSFSFFPLSTTHCIPQN